MKDHHKTIWKVRTVWLMRVKSFLIARIEQHSLMTGNAKIVIDSDTSCL